jgi:hypothetical protein
MDREPATTVAFMAAWAAARLLARAVDALTAVARDWLTAAAFPPSSATAQDSLVAVALALRRRRAWSCAWALARMGWDKHSRLQSGVAPSSLAADKNKSIPQADSVLAHRLLIVDGMGLVVLEGA